MPYDKWRSRLKKEKVPTFTQPDADDCGYYRLPITEPVLKADGQPNGRKRVTGWSPVAYFTDGPDLICVVNNREVDANQRDAIWTFCVQHPIAHELYQAVAERGEPWPDQPEPVAPPVSNAISNAPSIPAANREVAIGDNQPPEEVDPAVTHGELIDNAIKEPAPKVIKTVEEAELALGRKNRIDELRLNAEKTGEAIYQPLFREYKARQSLWSGIVNRAKVRATELNTAILTFRESERKRIAAENAAAEKLAQEAAAAETKRLADEAAANERAADRAISAGEAPPPPKVETPPPAPEPAPAPSAPPKLAGTYGNKSVREVEKLFVDQVTDWSALMLFYKDDLTTQTYFRSLAEKSIRAGITVPGITTRKGLI